MRTRAVHELVLGWTVPQRDVFYGAASLASLAASEAVVARRTDLSGQQD